MYAGGKTEELLGRIMTAERKAASAVATKVNPWGAGLPGAGFRHSGSGGLAPVTARAQMDECLKAMEVESVELLYLHAPDSETKVRWWCCCCCWCFCCFCCCCCCCCCC